MRLLFCECSNVNQNIKSTKIHKFWIKNFHQLFKSDLIKNAEWKVILISQLKIGCFCCWFFFSLKTWKMPTKHPFFSSDFYINLFGFCLVNVCNFIRSIFENLPKMRQKKIQWKKFMKQKKILCYRNKWWSSARAQIKLMK